MRFLLDQGLPRSTVAELLALGFEAVHVGQLGMAAASGQ
jgi:predicted nuclease of predicted toxin-antitoxin system